MKRISPVLVLLLAAGCANAGIGDWLNPFHWRKQHGNNAIAPAASGHTEGIAHSPRPSGHRGSRQLHGPSSLGYSNPHAHHNHAPPAPLLGSLPGSLDDGFKPSFPPGFANPPSYSPNLNPFATLAGHGSEAIAKGPFLPSQLTQYHTPYVAPGHATAPLTKAVPLPAKLLRPGYERGRYSLGGSRRGSRSGVPPHASVDSPSHTPDGTGPTNPDGSPVSYNEFPGLASAMEPMAQTQPEYEETPTQRPQAAPQSQRGPPRGGPFSFLTRGRFRNQRPPSHHHGEHGPHHGGRPFGRPHHSGPPGGPPAGPPGGQEAFNIDGPDGNPFGGDGPQGNPFGDDNGPAQNPFANHEPSQNLFESNGLLSGGPGPLGGGSGAPNHRGRRPGGPGGNQNIFFASSPGQGSPFAQGNLEQGPGQSPFGDQDQNQYNQGRPGGLFGQSSPQGPPRGPPRGPPGPPQSFFGGNGENDYPEQFQGGNRGTRQPQGPSQDYRPQPNGPPDGTQGFEGQENPGFFGALHDTDNNPGLSNFFGNGGPPQGGPPSQDGPNGGPGGPSGPNGGNPFGGPSGNPYGNNIQAIGENGPSGNPFGNHQHQQQQNQRPRKPPMRFSFRNPLASIFQGSSSSMPSHNGQLQMSASGSKAAVTLPVPKGGRSGILPFIRKPGSIIPLSSPKDPNYRPMSLGASNLNPITAYEPETAASGGFGGYGGGGLSHNGDRILYHVAGHKGPYSYQFGFDTGKGHNRIFRFEEKDGKGYVKGKYGFYDKTGKLNIINYQAHPQHGYHAERGHSHGHY